MNRDEALLILARQETVALAHDGDFMSLTEGYEPLDGDYDSMDSTMTDLDHAIRSYATSLAPSADEVAEALSVLDIAEV